MKIVIDDQYHNDENKQYTVDENGNINLFINLGDEVEESNTLDNSNNINYNEGENVIESDFTEFQEKVTEEVKTKDEEIIINEARISDEVRLSDEPRISDIEESTIGGTISSENPWKEEKFSRDYNSIYGEIENNLEEKYANKSERVEVEYSSSEPKYNRYEEKKVKEETGNIDVFSRLGSKEGVELKGARINLYLLNGVSPKLYDSKFSDSSGKVDFNNLPNGCYRIIAIVDRRFFEKPIYYNWNEVTIDKNNKNSNVLVVNRIKPGYYRR